MVSISKNPFSFVSNSLTKREREGKVKGGREFVFVCLTNLTKDKC